MKKILFALLLASTGASAQTDTFIVAFALDTFRIDSFFLVQRDSSFSATERRAVITERSLFFQDTSEFSTHIALVQGEYVNLAAQRTALSLRYDELGYRVARLQCLRDSVFYGGACSGIGARMMAMPPPEDLQPEQEGFWVLYPGGTVEWLYDIDKVKKNVSFTILGRDGRKTKFLKPKKAVKNNR